jgi:hypothetical protein
MADRGAVAARLDYVGLAVADLEDVVSDPNGTRTSTAGAQSQTLAPQAAHTPVS